MNENLDEVAVTAKRLPEPIPEIVVTASPIPWWMWGLGGVLLAVFLLENDR